MTASNNNQNNILIGAVIALLALNLIVLYFYHQQKKTTAMLQQQVQDQANKIDMMMNNVQALPTPTETQIDGSMNQGNPEPTSSPFNPVKVDVGNIQYTLPNGWTVTKNDGDLHFNRVSGGGYIHIMGYTYNGTGRREFYCNIMKDCVSQTTFDVYNLGNISGYVANNLDNSGGGSDFFGANGKTFYIINTYNPDINNPNAFVKDEIQLFRSLLF